MAEEEVFKVDTEENTEDKPVKVDQDFEHNRR